MKNTSQRNRQIIVVLAVAIGLYMVAVVPFLVQTSLERVLGELLVVIQDRPAFASGLGLFSLFYPLWRALIFISGITLLAISSAIYRGEEWTYPVMLLAFAVPSSGGMFMFLPYVSWVEGFPLPLVISFVCLVGFWGAIFLRHVDKAEKWAQFLALTCIGMLITHAFTIGVGNQRMLLTRLEKPLFAGIEWWILTWVGEVNWIAVIMLFAALPLLAMKKRAGWWLAFIAALSILAIDAPTQILRTKTLDYLYGSLIALGVLVSLSIPVLKQHLLGMIHNDEASATPLSPGETAGATA